MSVMVDFAAIFCWILHLISLKQCHTIAQSFLTPKISAKFRRGHPQRGRQIELG